MTLRERLNSGNGEAAIAERTVTSRYDPAQAALNARVHAKLLDLIDLGAIEHMPADKLRAELKVLVEKLLHVFRMLGYADSKVRLLSNRSAKGLDIPAGKIEKTLGIGFYRQFPNDFENAITSVNQGISILKLAPGSSE